MIGVGPTALVLVQGYLQLELLDPYGVGLAVGVGINILLRWGTNFIRFAEAWTIPLNFPLRRRRERMGDNDAQEWRPERPGGGMALLHSLADTLSDVTSSRSSKPKYTLRRAEDGSYSYGKYQIRPTSYEVREGPNNRAGWVPRVDLFEWGDETLAIQPLFARSTIAATKEEADRLAIPMAVHWIDAHE